MNDIIYIIDESGSMDIMSKEPIDSINNFIDEQKALNITGTKFTLIKFNNIVNIVYDDLLLKDVPKFSDYNPSNMTALYDAIGTAIENKKLKGEGNYNNIICVILTDGMENCSKKYDIDFIQSNIKDMEENHNWKFIYAAANQDAFEIGSSMGMNICTNFDTSEDGLLDVTRCISGGIKRLRSGESSSINIENVSVPILRKL